VVLQCAVGVPLCCLLEDLFRELIGDQLEEDADSHLFREVNPLALLVSPFQGFPRFNGGADFGD